MWVKQVLMALIGLSAGSIVAGGLFGFIVSLGVVSDFADRTGTANRIGLYEDAVALGGITGNLVLLYEIPLTAISPLLGVFGIFSGIYVGCWALALAEVLNVFPIFLRRINVTKGIGFVILGIAIGKVLGASAYFFFGW
jgi:stage V sporulation protein AB